MKTKTELANDIIKILINSGLSLSDQLKVIELVKERIIFCKKTGQKMQQIELF